MSDAIRTEGDWKAGLFSNPQTLLQPLNATGAALLYEDKIFTAGEVPGTHRLRDIGRWLDGKTERLTTTTSLGIDEPDFSALTPVASGLAAVPVSNHPGEYLIWFRPERVHTVTWGGNPFKPFIIGDTPADLSPRRSFAKWHQIVEGTCEPWSAADLAMARMIGEAVSDVVLQFRSLRMLLIQDQLEQLKQRVRPAGELVIVADPKGDIVLMSRLFELLPEEARESLDNIKALPSLFSEPAEVRKRLAALLRQRRSWRGEVSLQTDAGAKTMMMRADPVHAGPNRLLGFVLMFIDVTERKAVEAARRRLQHGIVRGDEISSMRLDANTDDEYLHLLSSVVGNAQRAALEISDGVDLARVPEMLEGVRSSVARTAELLEHLIWHSRDKSTQD